MANLRTIQFLRNANLYESLDAAITALETKANGQPDGSPIVGRYKAQTGDTADKYEVRSILGIVYNDTISFFNNTEEIDNVLQNLDYSGITTSNAAVVTNVTESDGIVSATSANVGSLLLTYYEQGTDSGDVASTDSINQAVAKLQNQIDAANDKVSALDKNSVSGESTVIIDVTQEDGLITASAANLTGVKLDGYTVGGDDSGKIANTDTLGAALGKLQGQINGMDKAASAVDGQVVTTVSETDGKVTETKANVKDLQLGGYAKTNDTGDIASADTINVALSKLENQIGANAITNADGSITVTPANDGSSTDIKVHIKNGEKVIKLDGEKGGIYTNLNVVKINEELPTTVKERYELRDSDNVKIGASIDIPKDSHIESITYITDSGDTHYQNLEYKYIDASGNTQTEYVDISSLVLEAEFASGVTITNHIAHGVVDPTSESFFSVGTDGFKVAGISGFVQTEIEKLDATVGESTVATGKHVAVQVVETDGKITAVNVKEDDIASATALTEEITNRTNADTALSNRLGEGVTSDNTATAQLAALRGTEGDTSGSTSIVGAKKYTDEKVAAVVADLDANVSGNSTHVTVGVKEENGVITNVTVSESDIANANDLSGLSAKTVTAVGMTGGTAQIAETPNEDGTKKITINVDGSTVSATGFNASASSGTPAATDSVSTVLSKLYANSKMQAVKAGSATTVTETANGTTVDVKLDATTESNATDARYTNGKGNVLQIKSDGLYLDASWDCGTF